MESAKLGLKELIAIGVGGMIGGGIFSVLGLAVEISGNAAPIAFAIGSLIALAAGYSYVKLALTFHNDGASFTYLEKAFPKNLNVAGIAGWTVIVGYIGTLALYAYTFGAYGADLLGDPNTPLVKLFLTISILLFFMVVNLWGVKASGEVEDVVVYIKILILTLFGIIGVTTIHKENFSPFIEHGTSSVFMAGALIFVAYEGFQLITNGVCETKNPNKNIPWGIYSSIVITSIIYIVLSIVAVGNLSIDQIVSSNEYALAAAAEPILGNTGRVLIGIAALLATSSAINGTVFGASRMMAEMATRSKMPKAFSLRSRTEVPWIAVIVLTAFAISFSVLNGLETIAAFSSFTFLLVSIAVSLANIKLIKTTKSNLWLILLGVALMTATIITLIVYLYENNANTLILIGAIYLIVIIIELLFSKRRLFYKRLNKSRGSK